MASGTDNELAIPKPTEAIPYGRDSKVSSQIFIQFVYIIVELP
jgi:hypothetical protein